MYTLNILTVEIEERKINALHEHKIHFAIINRTTGNETRTIINIV